MSQDDIIVTFPNGIVGSPDLKAFKLTEPDGSHPFKFLQSMDRPEVLFTCMDGTAVRMEYQVPLSDPDALLLNLGSEAEAMVLVIVMPHEDPRQATANLAGPLVINTTTLVGVQAMLDANQYPLKFPVFSSMEDVVIDFPAGLLGFAELRSFRLFEPMGGYPFKFLQSVEKPDISFSCIDVAAIKPDFSVPLGEEDAQILALEAPADALVLALVVIPKDPRKMTANLAGPLVINGKTRIGRQVVLNTEKFPLKFPILPER